jgi:hypothetical protein
MSPPHAPCGALARGLRPPLATTRFTPPSQSSPFARSEIQSCRHGGLEKCESGAPEPLKKRLSPGKKDQKNNFDLRYAPFRFSGRPFFFNGNLTRLFHRIFRELQLPTTTSYVGSFLSVCCRRFRHRCLFPLINPPGFCAFPSHRIAGRKRRRRWMRGQGQKPTRRI